MAKGKNPLLSLGAKGTIADTLTHQGRLGQAIVRTKPTPTGPKSLAQAYQRWLYEDYLYLWSQQSATERLAWRQEASKTHNTQLGAFMKDRLLTLPEIAGMWRLDFIHASQVKDSSKNANDGIVYGAGITEGLIGKCLILDGLNDYVNLGNDVSLRLTDDFTFEILVNPTDLGVARPIASKIIISGGRKGWLLFRESSNHFWIMISGGGTFDIVYSDVVYPQKKFYHVAFRRQAGLTHLFVDGERQAGSSNQALDESGSYLALGTSYADYHNLWWKGLLDQGILWNYPLADEVIKAHSERRYP